MLKMERMKCDKLPLTLIIDINTYCGLQDLGHTRHWYILGVDTIISFVCTTWGIMG